MSVVAVYHKADHDGRTSAAIIRHKYPDCKLIPMDYGMTLPWRELKSGDTVFVVDFCLEPIDRMVYLNSKCKMIWIDHHVSSIDEAKRVDLDPEGIREIGKSGCELTWSYLFPEESMPKAVRLLGRYDVWDHANPEVIPFQYGMLNENSNPANDELWSKLLKNDPSTISEILDNGKVIYKYQMKMYREYAKSYSFEASIGEYKAIVVNLGHCGSMAFEGVWDPSKHDVMIAFALHDTSVGVSIYSDKDTVDVSKIAMRYHGGGHKNASGWETKNIETFMKQIGRSTDVAVENVRLKLVKNN